jgi:hypothetical protein
MKCVGITNTYPASALTSADRIVPSLASFTEDLISGL